ncbi:hypothetical protein L7F22_007750 [Adiantum nelumboides]|nr:hypothetical protein [Adiantum nelumboides]
MVLTRAIIRDLSGHDIISTLQDIKAPLTVQFKEDERPTPQQHEEGQSSKQGEALKSSIQVGDDDVREEMDLLNNAYTEEEEVPHVHCRVIKFEPSEMVDSLVILQAINKAAKVSIPCTPSNDIFMMECLSLADSTSIVARLEHELRDWALIHMKNKSQAQKRSKMSDADFLDAYDERVEKVLHEVEKTFTRRAYDSVAIANPKNGVARFNLCVVRYTKWHEKANRFTINKITELAGTLLPPTEWWSHGLEVVSWCHEHPSDAWVYSKSEETRIYTTEMIEKLSESNWWISCPWFTDYPEEKCPANEIDLKKGKKTKGKEKMLDVEESKLPSIRGKGRGKQPEPKQHKKPPSKKRKTQEDMEDTDMEEDLEEDLEEDSEEALEEIRNTQQVDEGAPQEQAISELHIETPNSESTHPLDQEILSAFTLGTAVSRTSPLVSAWNEMRVDLIEAATALAKESLLDNGTFVAILSGEDLSDMV